MIEIDSPGGRLKESLEIAWRLQHIQRAHTVAYVPFRAYSGAAIASLGCDEIIMARNAGWGDAGVIFRDEESLFRFVPEKLLSGLADELRSWPRPRTGRPRWRKRSATRT